MNNKIKRKIISLTRELYKIPRGKNKHFTFFVKRNTIISLGWNDYLAKHPFCAKYNYGDKCVHSELAALIRFRGDYSDLRKCTLINTRINRFGEIGMSRPCEVCSKMIEEIGFKKVYYTDFDGDFNQLQSDGDQR